MKPTLAFSAEYARSIRNAQSATVSIASAMSEVSGTVSSVEAAQKQIFRVRVCARYPRWHYA